MSEQTPTDTTAPTTTTDDAADPVLDYLTLNRFADGSLVLDNPLTLGHVRDLRAERDIWRQRALDLQATAQAAVARAQRAEAVLEANDARADRAEDERDQLRHDIAEMTVCRDQREKYPAHTIVVTRLPAGFDHQDRREHEYVVGNDVVGWTSHQVTHPDACHELPYGRPCWFDEAWYEGPYRYDEVEPGTYQATWVSHAVGDHNGEYSHTDEYVHYDRTGDAPERPDLPEPSEGYSTEPPF